MSYLIFPYNAILPIEDGGQIFFLLIHQNYKEGKQNFSIEWRGYKIKKKTISKTPRLLDR